MIRITISPEALERAGGSAAVAIAKTGASLKNVTVLKDGTAILKGRRKNPARGRPGGAIRPKKGRKSYNRAQAKAVRS